MTIQRDGESPVKAVGYNGLIAWGIMTPVNGAAPTTVHAYGLAFARTGEGVWTATLTGEVPRGGFCSVLSAAFSAGGRKVYKTLVDNQTTGVITFTNETDAGGAADDVTGLSSVTVLVMGIRG